MSQNPPPGHWFRCLTNGSLKPHLGKMGWFIVLVRLVFHLRTASLLQKEAPAEDWMEKRALGTALRADGAPSHASFTVLAILTHLVASPHSLH